MDNTKVGASENGKAGRKNQGAWLSVETIRGLQEVSMRNANAQTCIGLVRDPKQMSLPKMGHGTDDKPGTTWAGQRRPKRKYIPERWVWNEPRQDVSLSC